MKDIDFLNHYKNTWGLNNMKDTNTLREEFIKDFCEVKPYRNTELIYFKGFCDKNYNLIPTPKTIIQWIEETYIEKFNQKLEEIEELIETERIDFDNSDTLVKKVFDSHNTALDLALQIIKNKKI